MIKLFPTISEKVDLIKVYWNHDNMFMLCITKLEIVHCGTYIQRLWLLLLLELLYPTCTYLPMATYYVGIYDVDQT